MFSRRQLLGGGLALGAGGLLVPRLLRADDHEPRFVIVMGCFGGASMLDAFMPVDVSEAVTTSRGTLIGYDTTQIGNIRCVDRAGPVDFLSAHGHQTVAMATQSSSVNHFVAQARAVNGRDVFSGRTLCEAVAAAYGVSCPLPNVNMGRGGYALPGSDPTLGGEFAPEIVTNPVTWPLSTHGHAGLMPLGEGIQDPSMREIWMAEARALRDGPLEAASPFSQTFQNSRMRRDLLVQRAGSDGVFEAERLIEQLLFVPDLGEILPLSEYGIDANDEAWKIEDALPKSFPATTTGQPRDRLHAQAALAYLLLRTGSSVAVTLTEPGTDGFLAFDNSHTDHRSAQEDHWDRVLDVTSRLIGLLESAEYVRPDGEVDGTIWDRTMIVFATEFGRDKWDTGSGFGTGHHLNNGLLVVSPLLAGDQTLGETDPNNGFTTGFDLETGEATPYSELGPGEDPLFSDERLPPAEEVVYGGLLDVLGVEFEGQETIPILKG